MTITKKTAGLQPLIEVLEMFRRECAPDMPLHEVLTFLYIMQTGGDLSQNELQKRLGMSQSAVSRAVNKFERINQRKEKGYNMVQYYADPMDTRSKRIKIRPSGEDFAQRVTVLLPHFDKKGSPYASLKARQSVEDRRPTQRTAHPPQR